MVRAWGGPLFWVCSVPGGISLLTSPPPFKQYKLFWGTLLTTLKRCPLKAGTSSSHSRKRRDKFLDLFQARFRRKSALSTMRAKPNHFSRVFAAATNLYLAPGINTVAKDAPTNFTFLAVEHSHRSALRHI